VLKIFANVEHSGENEWTVREVHFTRTARRLFDGTAYVRRSRLEVPAEEGTSMRASTAVMSP